MSSNYGGNNGPASTTTMAAAYEQNYSKDINLKMRVPQTITVVDGDQPQPLTSPPDVTIVDPIRTMQVPERIVLSLDGSGATQLAQGEPQTPRPAPEFEIPAAVQQPYEPVQMGTPPRVLTLENGSIATDDNFSIAPTVDPFLSTLEAQDEENEINLLQRRVTTLSRKVHNLEEDYRQASKLNMWLIGVTLAFSFINGLALMRRR